MKKNYFVYALALLSGLIIYGFSGNDSRYPGGSPAAYTGSPADGKDCTQCHGGSVSTISDIITSNIPETGYVPGETYDITLTVEGSNRKGFEIAPQNIDGDLLGTLIAGSGSKLVGGDAYITQSSSVFSNPAVWDFQWTAPEEGTGEVVFYGAVTIGEHTTKTTSYTVQEDLTAGINLRTEQSLSIYPNPVVNKLHIEFNLESDENVSIKLINLNGQIVDVIENGYMSSGYNKFDYNIDNQLKSGIYLLSLNIDNKEIIRKIIIH